MCPTFCLGKTYEYLFEKRGGGRGEGEIKFQCLKINPYTGVIKIPSTSSPLFSPTSTEIDKSISLVGIIDVRVLKFASDILATFRLKIRFLEITKISVGQKPNSTP